MRTDIAPAIHRLDYVAPSFWVEKVDLGFDLDPKATRVAARSVLRRNKDSAARDLVLVGEEIE